MPVNRGPANFFWEKKRWKSRGYPQVIHKLWITLLMVDSTVFRMWMFFGALDVVGVLKNK